VHDAIAAANGPDTRSISFLTTDDQAGSVRADVQRIRSWPYFADLTVGGFVYDLETGKLQQIC
jgi:carbonic anhydrase